MSVIIIKFFVIFCRTGLRSVILKLCTFYYYIIAYVRNIALEELIAILSNIAVEARFSNMFENRMKPIFETIVNLSFKGLVHPIETSLSDLSASIKYLQNEVRMKDEKIRKLEMDNKTLRITLERPQTSISTLE